jgi:hypothetical protein
MKTAEFTPKAPSRLLVALVGAVAMFLATSIIAPQVQATECSQDSDCDDRKVCNLAINRCIYLHLPCGSDADCAGGQLCNPGSNRCEYLSDECNKNADCNDGLFCNGEEYCNRFRGCKPGAAACGDGVACTVDSCDEDTDSCSHVASDAACDDGSYCSGEETCDVTQGCVSAPPVDCGGAEDFCGVAACDEETRSCIVVPQNDGLDCQPRDADTCMLSAVCSSGACFVTPLCSPGCERCDPEGCASLCGNPYANSDDRVNTTDALYTLRVAVELETCDLCVCDVNGDGTVTATDTLLMLRQIVGLGDLFVCPAAGGPTTTTTSTTLPQL